MAEAFTEVALQFNCCSLLLSLPFHRCWSQEYFLINVSAVTWLQSASQPHHPLVSYTSCHNKLALLSTSHTFLSSGECEGSWHVYLDQSYHQCSILCLPTHILVQLQVGHFWENVPKPIILNWRLCSELPSYYLKFTSVITYLHKVVVFFSLIIQWKIKPLNKENLNFLLSLQMCSILPDRKLAFNKYLPNA